MIKPSKTREEIELKVLADFVSHPGKMGAAVVECGLTKEDFGDPALGEAFARLLEAETPDADEDKMMRAFISAMPEKYIANGAGEETIKKASVGSAFVRDDIASLKWYALDAKHRQTIWAITQNPNLTASEQADEMSKVNAEYVEAVDKLDVFCGILSLAEDEDLAGVAATPPEMLDMPGFVNDYADYIYRTAHRPNRVLAFAGALAMLSRLVARKYTDARKTQTNLYLVALGNSGVGKDQPRKVNKELSLMACVDGVADQIGSGEGLEDAMFVDNAMLFLMDEFDTLMNVLKDPNPISERMYSFLLTFFSDAGSVHKMRRKALTPAEKQAIASGDPTARKASAACIYNPSLTLLATAIPDRFYKSLTLRALENGLLARCLVFVAGARGSRGKSQIEECPPELLKFAQELADSEVAQPRDQMPELTMVHDEEGLDKVTDEVNAKADEFYAKAEKAGDRAGMAVWNRAVELTNKLALLYALSENKNFSKVTIKGYKWAWKLVMHLSKQMLSMVDAYVSDSRLEQKCKDVLNYLGRCKDKQAMRSVITKALHINSKDMDDVVRNLEDRDDAETIRGSGKMVFIRLKKSTRGKQ